jgi:hypothetical protein
MSGLTSVYSRPAAATLSTSCWRSSIAKFWRELFRDFLGSYRPELHYMRGAGPRWCEKHGAALAHDGGIFADYTAPVRTEEGWLEQRQMAATSISK